MGKIEPVFNIYTALSRTLTPIFLFAPLQRINKKKLFLSRKNTGGGQRGHCPLAPPPSYPYAILIVRNVSKYFNFVTLSKRLLPNIKIYLK